MPKTLLPIILMGFVIPALASQPGKPAVPASGAPLAAQSSHASISWSHLQEEIAKTVCMLSTQVEGREYLAPVAGFRKECGQANAVTPVAQAVDRAFEEAGVLIGSLQPSGIEEAHKPGLSAEERNRIESPGTPGSPPSPSCGRCSLGCARRSKPAEFPARTAPNLLAW